MAVAIEDLESERSSWKMLGISREDISKSGFWIFKVMAFILNLPWWLRFKSSSTHEFLVVKQDVITLNDIIADYDRIIEEILALNKLSKYLYTSHGLANVKQDRLRFEKQPNLPKATQLSILRTLYEPPIGGSIIYNRLEIVAHSAIVKNPLTPLDLVKRIEQIADHLYERLESLNNKVKKFNEPVKVWGPQNGKEWEVQNVRRVEVYGRKFEKILKYLEAMTSSGLSSEPDSDQGVLNPIIKEFQDIRKMNKQLCSYSKDPSKDKPNDDAVRELYDTNLPPWGTTKNEHRSLEIFWMSPDLQSDFPRISGPDSGGYKIKSNTSLLNEAPAR